MITSSVGLVDILTLIVATVLPLLNGLITKTTWAPAVRGVILAGLSFVASFLNEFITALTSDQSFDIGLALIKFGGVFVIAVASYFGILSRPLSTPIETVIESPKTDIAAYTKGQLITLVEGRTGTTPSSKLTKEELGNLIDGTNAIVTTVEPSASIASIVAAKGVK